MLNISAIAAVMISLGTTTSVDVTIQGDQGTVDLAVDSTALTQDKDHDVSFTVTPSRVNLTGGTAQAKLTIKARTSAPSFTGGKFALVARSGGTETHADVPLTVQPVYVVNVVQKKEGKCADNRNVTDRVSWICDFDSPAETVYFRKHDPSLQVIFHNATNDTLIIHGSDAIEHMPFSMAPLAPGKEYKPPAIKGAPSDPSNLKGSYTLHEIYRPSRDAVFNAETIPATRSQ
jgi:hypothetical protein